MRLKVGIWKWLCLALIVGSQSKAALGSTTVVAWYHCSGSAALKANTNLVALNKMLELPSTAAFQKMALQGLSKMLAGDLNLGTNESAASLIEPLLTNVLRTESLGSFGGAAANSLSFILAVKLDAGGTQLWQDNLAKTFGGPGEEFAVEETKGWRWNKSGSNSLWILPARGWLLVGRGDELLPMQGEYLQKIKQQGSPVTESSTNWFEADLDMARAAAWTPEWSHLFKPARIKISVTDETNQLRTTARVIYPEAIYWHSSAWEIPTDLIRSPLASFTGGQDVAAFLNLNPIYTQLGGGLLTNQFYAWALTEMPLQSYLAWPADATNVLQMLAKEAPAAFNAGLKGFNGSELVWQPDLGRLYLANLGMIAPDLTVARDHGRQYMLSTIFPLPPKNPPPPDELLNQLNGRTNLVYYDWEFTGPRLQEWRLLAKALFEPSGKKTHEDVVAERIEARWLAGLRPMLGNSVTEITRVAPNELLALRNSPVLFTAIEMQLLSDWLTRAGTGSVHVPPPAK